MDDSDDFSRITVRVDELDNRIRSLAAATREGARGVFARIERIERRLGLAGDDAGDDFGDDFGAMSDPDFLAERKRVREAIDALQERYRLVNAEFDRRASAAWGRAS
jgi:tetrahydromethanopterin S-methyltransferase subunit G